MILVELKSIIKQTIRAQIGPIASPDAIYIVKGLPKTRSGKILRKLMRSIADGDNFQVPSTIDDENIVDEIIEVLTKYEIGSFGLK